MPSFQATFVRSDNHPATVRLLRKLARTERVLRGLWNVAWHVERPWVGISAADARELPWIAAVASRGLDREVVGLEFHTVSDSLAYHLFRSGEAIRSLVYGFQNEACWEVVSGAAQPWERDTETSDSATWMIDAIREFHDLPSTFTVQSRFGPVWPLRLVPFLW